jgi:hypothetical protein
MNINIHIKKQQLNLKYLTPLWLTISSLKILVCPMLYFFPYILAGTISCHYEVNFLGLDQHWCIFAFIYLVDAYVDYMSISVYSIN